MRPHDIRSIQQSKNKIKKTPFTIAHKRINVLVIKLIKGQDLYTENYKTLLKEIEGDTKKWKHSVITDWKNRHS